MRKPRKKGKALKIAAGTLIATVVFAWATNRTVLNASEGKIYTDIASVPDRPVAVVLGTAPTLQGYKNLYFERRMTAAAKLYQAKKVRKILVSGDNGSRGYDEPTAMRDSLVARGIPETDIVLDYAGFRTLDTIARARKVFGLQRATIVTDDFHLPRALYLAQEYGIDAVGFQTMPIPRSVSPWTYTREIGARTLVWTDIHLLNRQPHFTGPRETSLLSYAK